MPLSHSRAMSQLPRLSETWFIAITQLRTWIAPPNEEPHRPYLILILSADEGAVRGSNIISTSPTPRLVWDTLAQAMQHPAPNSGRRGAPQRIVIADSALADGILPFFADAQLEIDVYEQPLPDEVGEIIRDLENHLRGDKPEHPSLLSASGVTPELLRGFYSATADYYRAAPWVHLNNYQVIALRHPAEKDYRYAMSMGQGGIEYGLATYLRWSDVVRQFTEDENPMNMLPTGGLHSLFFDNIAKVPFDDLDAIEKFGFEIAAPEAYPIPVIVEGPDRVRRPSREDLAWYEAALRAIPLVVRDHLKPNGRGDYGPFETTLQVPTHLGTIPIEIKYPAGELPLAEQPAQRLDWSKPEEEDGEMPVFDRRLMEGPMQELARQIGAEQGWGDPDLKRAQKLMYRAFEERNPAKRIALAHDALAISPNCADAYVLLAEEEADTVQRALAYYEQGVAAGERALGKEFFEENTGHFWGILETRPYMRARQGLADALWRLKRQEEARDHFRDMLRLNPGDNQGIRDLLLALLLEMERDDEARQLLEQYRDEWTAVWLYTGALLEFRQHGASGHANKSLADALEENPHVPAYLTGRKRIPNRLPPLVGWGEESEAIAYASDHLNHWRRTPGAVEWLSESKMPKPDGTTAMRRKRRAKDVPLSRKRKRSR
jgi:tetratricopeptide (TPR) repeat protein